MPWSFVQQRVSSKCPSFIRKTWKGNKLIKWIAKTMTIIYKILIFPLLFLFNYFLSCGPAFGYHTTRRNYVNITNCYFEVSFLMHVNPFALRTLTLWTVCSMHHAILVLWSIWRYILSYVEGRKLFFLQKLVICNLLLLHVLTQRSYSFKDIDNELSEWKQTHWLFFNRKKVII